MSESHHSNQRSGISGGQPLPMQAPAAAEDGRDRPLVQMSQQGRAARYGDFGRKARLIHEGDRTRFDMDDCMAHPQVRFTIGFIEGNWDKIRHNPA